MQVLEPKLEQSKPAELKKMGDNGTAHLFPLISERFGKEASRLPIIRSCTLSCIPTSAKIFPLQPGQGCLQMVVGAWPKFHLHREADVCSIACPELFLLHFQL